jgi:hypothetical protein
VANLSDTYATFPYNATKKTGIPSIYPNGFCGGYLLNSGGTLTPNFWPDNCRDTDLSIRYCIDTDPTQCPLSNINPLYPLRTVVTLPNGSYPGPKLSPPYSAEDYARDVTDAAALLLSKNPNEPVTDNGISIFSVGLGDAAAAGSDLLRYMAAVGDDGDRETDPCDKIVEAVKGKTNCGNYYFAQTANDLYPVFDSIASRIYTKISE